ncbi:MAG: hypothetical protein HRU75_00495 [Planctomycetia bacterium]|nr:MAG: hypothetical protein HRU75_00495 [Planctomycetia bacterium]
MGHHSGRLSLLLLAGVLFAAPSEADLRKLLAAVPDDAEAALLIPNVNDLASGVSAFGKGAKITAWGGLTGPSLLAAIDFPYPTDGLDLAAGLVIYTREGDDEPGAILFPKDVAVWKRTVAAEDAADGLFRLGDEHSGWGAVRDGRIVVADEKERVATARWTGRVAEKTGSIAALDRAQVVAVVDVPAWKESVRGTIELFGTFVEMGMPADGEENEIAAMRAFFGAVGKGFADTVEDAERFAVGLRISGDAARLDVLTEFGGATGSAIEKAKGSGRELLRGLPASAAMVVMAFETATPIGAGSAWDELVREIIKLGASPETAETRAKVDEAVNAWSKVADSITGCSLAVGAAGSKFALFGQYFADNPAEAARRLDDYNRVTIGLNSYVKGATISNATEEIAGKRTSITSVTLDDSREEAAIIAAAYGTPLVIATAESAVGVGLAMGSDVAARRGIKELIEIKPDAGMATGTMGETARRSLSPRPLGVMLIDVAECARASMRVVQAMGLALPNIRFGPAGPIAMGVYIERRVVRLELHVPTSAVRSITEAVERLMGDEGEAPIEQ